MAETNVNVTEGSGKRLHAWDRTISATVVLDQFTLPGEYPYASYVALGAGISTATASDHVLQVMSGASSYLRIRRIRIEQQGNATTAALAVIQVWRLTTAGTGGTTVTPRPFDTGDSAATASAMTLPTAKGTEGTLIFQFTNLYRQAVSATSAVADDAWEWTQQPNQKPLIVPTGTANGIAIKHVTGVAAATCNVQIEFVETTWLGA